MGFNKEIKDGKGALFDLTEVFYLTTEICERQGKWTTAYELYVRVYEYLQWLTRDMMQIKLLLQNQHTC